MNANEKKLLKEAGEQSKVHAARAAQRRAAPTPGTWTVTSSFQGGYSHRVETVDGFTGKPAKAGSPAASPICSVHAKGIAGMAEANAWLIASAPELLAALKNHHYDEVLSKGRYAGPDVQEMLDLHRKTDNCKTCATIAKAEGR